MTEGGAGSRRWRRPLVGRDPAESHRASTPMGLVVAALVAVEVVYEHRDAVPATS